MVIAHPIAALSALHQTHAASSPAGMQDDAAAPCQDDCTPHAQLRMSAALQQHVLCGEMTLAGTQLRAARHSGNLTAADHTLEELQVLASATAAATEAAAAAAELVALARTMGACGADDGTAAVILEAARTSASEAAAAQALVEARRAQAAAVQEEARSYAAAHDEYIHVLRALRDSDVVQPDEPSSPAPAADKAPFNPFGQMPCNSDDDGDDELLPPPGQLSPAAGEGRTWLARFHRLNTRKRQPPQQPPSEQPVRPAAFYYLGILQATLEGRLEQGRLEQAKVQAVEADAAAAAAAWRELQRHEGPISRLRRLRRLRTMMTLRVAPFHLARSRMELVAALLQGLPWLGRSRASLHAHEQRVLSRLRLALPPSGQGSAANTHSISISGSAGSSQVVPVTASAKAARMQLLVDEVASTLCATECYLQLQDRVRRGTRNSLADSYTRQVQAHNRSPYPALEDVLREELCTGDAR